MVNTTDYKVTRYELYPADSPTGTVVGFTATCSPNGRSQYWDTLVASGATAGKTQDEITGLAWGTLSGTMVPWGEVNEAKSPLIGTTWKTISGSA